MMEKVSAEPQYMLDGSVDWLWFYRRRAMLIDWYDAGLCVDCGVNPTAKGYVVCKSPDCCGIVMFDEKHARCSFCGKTGNHSTGSSSPTTPIHVQWCSDCNRRGRRPPKMEEVAGQAALF